MGEVTGKATGTGPAAIAQCTGEDGRGMLFGSSGLCGPCPITDGERKDAISRLSVQTSVSWFGTRSRELEPVVHGSTVCGGHLEVVKPVLLMATGSWRVGPVSEDREK